jgi:hypothetical protein
VPYNLLRYGIRQVESSDDMPHLFLALQLQPAKLRKHADDFDRGLLAGPDDRPRHRIAITVQLHYVRHDATRAISLESYDETLSRRAYLAVNQKLTLFKHMRLDFARRSIPTKIFAKENGAAGCECSKNQEHGESALKF